MARSIYSPLIDELIIYLKCVKNLSDSDIAGLFKVLPKTRQQINSRLRIHLQLLDKIYKKEYK